MISKTKLNKVRKLAGAEIRFLDVLPLDVQKKLTAEQIATVLRVIEHTSSRAIESANAERLARNVARFHPGAWVRKAKGWFTDWFKPVDLPRLAIGLASIRARLGR